MNQDLLLAMQTKMHAAVQTLHQNHRGTCSVDGCPNDKISKGLCNAHYLRQKRGIDLAKPVQASAIACIDCGAKIDKSGGWKRCAKHFKFVRQKIIKTALVEIMGNCCQHCHQKFSLAVYDFHHLSDKDANPSFVIANSSLEKIANEMSKCILLCANCHRMEHEREF